MTAMRDLIAELPAQLEWAARTDLPDLPSHAEVIVVGMGGSGIAGDIASVTLDRRVTVNKGYGLPSWAPDAEPLVIAVSHSGNTEETASAVAAAVSAGLTPAVVTTGGRLAEMAEQRNWPMVQVPAGPQPRAAVGYLAGAVARLAGGSAEHLLEASEVAAGILATRAEEAAALAEGLAGKIAVIYGGDGVAAVAANRWKTQINENSKAPAYWSVFPELDHNEIVGWEAHPEGVNRSVGVVMLRDRDEHPRVAKRIELTSAIMADLVPVVGEVEARGSSALARIFSLIAIGDLVSVEIAERTGVDPMPVETIERLKKELADE